MPQCWKSSSTPMQSWWHGLGVIRSATCGTCFFLRFLFFLLILVGWQCLCVSQVSHDCYVGGITDTYTETQLFFLFKPIKKVFLISYSPLSPRRWTPDVSGRELWVGGARLSPAVLGHPAAGQLPNDSQKKETAGKERRGWVAWSVSCELPRGIPLQWAAESTTAVCKHTIKDVQVEPVSAHLGWSALVWCRWRTPRDDAAVSTPVAHFQDKHQNHGGMSRDEEALEQKNVLESTS